MYTYLCGLALADLGYMAFSLTAFYFDSSFEIRCKNKYYRDQIIIPICNSFKSTSDYIVICMTINRCLVIKNITELKIQARAMSAWRRLLHCNARDGNDEEKPFCSSQLNSFLYISFKSRKKCHPELTLELYKTTF